MVDVNVPSEVKSPGDLKELGDVLLEASKERQTLVAIGGSTKASWGGQVLAPHLKIDTKMLNGVEHSKEDQTVIVGTGKNFHELQQELSKSGQRISLDPSDIENRATVGGIVATADCGPLRFRFGSPRELILGARVAFADGTLAHSGGKVIKNVAGYDLAKLMVGSFGTLGVIGEVVFRLHPLPERRITLSVGVDPDQATQLTIQILASVIEPNALEYGAGNLVALIEGTESGASAQAEKLVSLIGSEVPGARVQVIENLSDATIWQEFSSARASEGRLHARMVTRVNRLGEVHHAAGQGSTRAEMHVISHAGSGVHDLIISGDGELDDYKETLDKFRIVLGDMTYPMTIRNAVAPLDQLVDLLGSPVPVAVKVMQRVKASLDPENLMAPGRFRPWW